MRKLVAGLLLAVTLTGCSATSALTGLVGSKPDVSAQVGAENTKQTVGLNNKVDSSTTNKLMYQILTWALWTRPVRSRCKLLAQGQSRQSACRWLTMIVTVLSSPD